MSAVTPARRRLATAARALATAVLTTEDATDGDLDDAAAAVERAVERLEAADGGDARERRAEARRRGEALPRSPLRGVNPLSSPLEYALSDGGIEARGAFGVAHEGPPGSVHGGWVALAFDEALGAANVANGHPGVTGRLTVRYRRPTPLETELTLSARTVRADGRRIIAIGTLTAHGVVTAEAEGLFVRPRADRGHE